MITGVLSQIMNKWMWCIQGFHMPGHLCYISEETTADVVLSTFTQQNKSVLRIDQMYSLVATSVSLEES